MFRQARWDEPLIYERSSSGKTGHIPKGPDDVERSSVPEPMSLIPESLRQNDEPELPKVSEIEVIRHYTRLSEQNYSIDSGIYPLGSCTMKYNPKLNERVVSSTKVRDMHPYQDPEFSQGMLEALYLLANYLAEIVGMAKISLQPAAGAQGEFLSALIMRAYHAENGELEERTEMIVPDSAHGTNPASASMAGFKVVVVPSNTEGTVDLDALSKLAGSRTAGFMITNPSTLGIFEKHIIDIARIIHDAGGLLYYDGANLNALLGKARPGDMGFDIAHINIHKTFSTPHGGGGPGAGPIGVVEKLEKYLPVPTVEFDGKKYYLDYNKPSSIGKIKCFHGNVMVLMRALAYILAMGAEGLAAAGELSVINANYVARRILSETRFELPFSPDQPRKHEFVISAAKITKETGVRALNISKRLLDHGIHAPTTYFPQIVEEAMMVEPTETESKEELDALVSAFVSTAKEAYENPEIVLEAPHGTTVTRVDEVKGSHPKTLCLSWKQYQKIYGTSKKL